MNALNSYVWRFSRCGAAVCAVMFLGVMGLPIAMGHGVHIQHEGQHNGHATTSPVSGAHAHHEGKPLEIVMRDGVYHVMQEGRHQQGLTLNAGEGTTIVLRNEDTVAHEFITPLFRRTEVQFSGDAVGLFGKEAAGFRLDAGKSLTLRFKTPFSEPFQTMYDVIWCNLHKHAESQGQHGELLLVATNDLS